MPLNFGAAHPRRQGPPETNDTPHILEERQLGRGATFRHRIECQHLLSRPWPFFGESRPPPRRCVTARPRNWAR